MKPVALVTGANRGIGQEACKHLAKHGFTAILTSRDLAKGERVAAELQSAGLDIIYMPLDVTSAASIEQLAADVKAAFGRLDVLVNNAAVYLDEGVSVFDVPIDAFRVTFETNFYGPLLLCRAFMPLMIERHYGRIINVSSEYGSLAHMGGYTAAYKLSKTALNGLTRTLAAEARRFGDIKVNALCPGWVRTEMGGQHAPRSVQDPMADVLWLATLPADGPTGGFFRDKQPIPW
ncbi:MAG TPA: SDR family oxidoreductase [Aggregatilineales bacterium]|nr:SDR family oxidoreductase [Anaerolineae bacterium]HUN08563.1 SDR family oxidoreductase [Aggregatilineales bacterium]